eukprot:scaffold16189_cov125-Cylindrotheca_fusiformis.AAC.10
MDDKKSIADEDYGPVRDRRDFHPLEVCLRPILPCPSRELTFTNRTGWRYSPFVPFSDRLGGSRSFQDGSSTNMSIPDSWQESRTGSLCTEMTDSDQQNVDTPRKRLQELSISKGKGKIKKQRVNDKMSMTVETSATAESHPTHESWNDRIGINTDATMVSESTSSTNSFRKCDEAGMFPTSLGNGAGNNFGTEQSTLPMAKFWKPTDIPTCDTIPKAAMCALYGKKPRKTQLSNKQYLTWNDGGKSHELMFTSIFLCPITHEAFLAGKYGDNFEQRHGLVWYKRKTLAEHAAAARAYDCFMMRENFDTSTRLGIDPPYRAKDCPLLPLHQIPLSILQTIQDAEKKTNHYQKEESTNYQSPLSPNNLPLAPDGVRPRYPTPQVWPPDPYLANANEPMLRGNPYQESSSRPP